MEATETVTTVTTSRKGRNTLYRVECACGSASLAFLTTFDEREAEQMYGDHLDACPLNK